MKTSKARLAIPPTPQEQTYLDRIIAQRTKDRRPVNKAVLAQLLRWHRHKASPKQIKGQKYFQLLGTLSSVSSQLNSIFYNSYHLPINLNQTEKQILMNARQILSSKYIQAATEMQNL